MLPRTKLGEIRGVNEPILKEIQQNLDFLMGVAGTRLDATDVAKKPG